MVDYSSMARGSPTVLALVQKEPEARICQGGLGLEAVAAKGRDADGTGK